MNSGPSASDRFKCQFRHDVKDCSKSRMIQQWDLNQSFGKFVHLCIVRCARLMSPVLNIYFLVKPRGVLLTIFTVKSKLENGHNTERQGCGVDNYLATPIPESESDLKY